MITYLRLNSLWKFRVIMSPNNISQWKKVFVKLFVLLGVLLSSTAERKALCATNPLNKPQAEDKWNLFWRQAESRTKSKDNPTKINSSLVSSLANPSWNIEVLFSSKFSLRNLKLDG